MNRALDELRTVHRRFGELLAELEARSGQAAVDRSGPTPTTAGGLSIDVERLAVRANGRAVELGSGVPFALMHTLTEHIGRFVSHAALEAKVWPGRLISDSARKNAIARLRKTLRDGGLGCVAERIESSPGHYRLTTPRKLEKGRKRDRDGTRTPTRRDKLSRRGAK